MILYSYSTIKPKGTYYYLSFIILFFKGLSTKCSLFLTKTSEIPFEMKTSVSVTVCCKKIK